MLLDEASKHFRIINFPFVGKGNLTSSVLVSETVGRGCAGDAKEKPGSVPFNSNPRCSGSAEGRRVRGAGGEKERREGRREKEKKRWSELFEHGAASLRGESTLVVPPPSLLSSLPGPQYLRAPRTQERSHVRIGRQGRSFRDEQWS